MEKKQSLIDEALNYLEQKYNETFEYISIWGADYSNTSGTRLLTQCGSFPDAILVNCVKDEDDFIFSDNYLAVRYKQEMTEFIQSTTDVVFGRSVVFYEVLKQPLSPDLPADSSFEVYSKDEMSGIFATVVVPNETFDESLVQVLAEKICEFGISAQLSFVSLDGGMLESLDSMALDHVLSHHQYRYYAVVYIHEDEIVVNRREVW